MNSENTKIHSIMSFRNIRELAKLLCSHEQIKLNNFDTHRIIKYYCTGANLQGTNVSYKTESGYSVWVNTNNYTVFEIPHKGNIKNGQIENSLVFAYNHLEKYWVFANLTITRDSLKAQPTVTIIPICVFIAVMTDQKINALTRLIGQDCYFQKDETSWPFDIKQARAREYEKYYSESKPNKKKH